MLSDTGITIAGHAVTSFQILVAGALLLCAATMLLALRRELKASVKRSAVTDELSAHLLRIAGALERIANQATDSANSAGSCATGRDDVSKEPEPDAEPASEEAHRIAYSMFGR